MNIAEDDHDHETSARRGSLAWKSFSCVGIFVMRLWSTKNHRSLLEFSGVGAWEEQENTVIATQKKVYWAAEKVDT